MASWSRAPNVVGELKMHGRTMRADRAWRHGMGAAVHARFTCGRVLFRGHLGSFLNGWDGGFSAPDRVGRGRTWRRYSRIGRGAVGPELGAPGTQSMRAVRAQPAGYVGCPLPDQSPHVRYSACPGDRAPGRSIRSLYRRRCRRRGPYAACRPKCEVASPRAAPADAEMPPGTTTRCVGRWAAKRSASYRSGPLAHRGARSARPAGAA